jgi:hypothetical protein
VFKDFWYYNFSKSAKWIIAFNIVITLAVLALHFYNVYRISETNAAIAEWMAKTNETRKSAIYSLEREGVELFLNQEMSTYWGIFMCLLTLGLSYVFARYNGFFVGFSLATASTLSSLVGGLLLFLVLLSGKSETEVRKRKREFKDTWEEFVHHKSLKE